MYRYGSNGSVGFGSSRTGPEWIGLDGLGSRGKVRCVMEWLGTDWLGKGRLGSTGLDS